MNLYVMRHAIAANKVEWKGPDSDRPLTEEGIRKMKKGSSEPFYEKSILKMIGIEKLK